MLNGKNNEEKIWNYLISAGLTPYGAAGLMGNLREESGLRPNNLQNTYENKPAKTGGIGYTDATYTTAVDTGTYRGFVYDGAGYGLAQWTQWSRKKNLLALAKRKGTSVGDLETQLEFLRMELTVYGLLDALKNATSVQVASDLILLKFEMPADQSKAVRERRAGYGQIYFNKYAKEAAMTEEELRAKVVSIAQSYVGCNERDGSHRKIIDLYNSHRPLARGHAVTYTEAWCAAFASATAIQAGLTDIIPVECSCGELIKLFKKLGSWQERDDYVPAPGDYIFYDWQDGDNYAATDNTGAPDHVGIVEKVTGKTISVIEGNYSDAVKRGRPLTVNGRYIRGYGVPKYGTKATASGATTAPIKPSTKPPAPAASQTVKEKKATGAAKSFDKRLAGTYTVTAGSGLHIRDAAGTNAASLVILPHGAKVKNYGYYTLAGDVKWLYIQAVHQGVTYTGFSSGNYLRKQ